MNIPLNWHAIRYLESDEGQDTPLHIAVGLASIDWDKVCGKEHPVQNEDIHRVRQAIENLCRRHSGGQQ